MRILVAIALPNRQEVVEVELAEGATVAEALEAARLPERFPGPAGTAPRVGIWSRPCGLDARLRDGDRVEVYRPLVADPKDQRRLRARLKPPTRPGSGS